MRGLSSEVLFEIVIGGVLVVVIFLLTLLVVNAAGAHSDGHMRYPPECCSNQDCAPVDKIEQVPTQKLAAAGMVFGPTAQLPSHLVVTTKHGTVMVPENFKRRPSMDGRWHACISGSVMGIVPPRLICIFEPPSM